MATTIAQLFTDATLPYIRARSNYRVEYQISGVDPTSSGDLQVTLGNKTTPLRTANGVYTDIVNDTASTANVKLLGSPGFKGNIDYIYVTEI